MVALLLRYYVVLCSELKENSHLVTGLL